MRLSDAEWDKLVEEKEELWLEFLKQIKFDKSSYFGDYYIDEAHIDIGYGEVTAFLHDFTKFLTRDLLQQLKYELKKSTIPMMGCLRFGYCNLCAKPIKDFDFETYVREFDFATSGHYPIICKECWEDR